VHDDVADAGARLAAVGRGTGNPGDLLADPRHVAGAGLLGQQAPDLAADLGAAGVDRVEERGARGTLE
jgi:hypothetical protein